MDRVQTPQTTFLDDPAAGRLETPLHPCLTPLRTSVATQKTPGWGDVRANPILTLGAVYPNLHNGRNRLIQVSERSCLCAWVGCSSRRAFWAAPRRKCPPQSLRVCWAKQTLIEKRATLGWIRSPQGIGSGH